MFGHTKYNGQHELHEEAEQCYICDVKFRKWGISGRHQCRVCLKAICTLCSKQDILGGQKVRRCLLNCTKHYPQNLAWFQTELAPLFNEKNLLPILYGFYGRSPFDAVSVAARVLSGSIISKKEGARAVSNVIQVSANPYNGTVHLDCSTMKEQDRLIMVLKTYFNIDRYALIQGTTIVLQWNVMQQMRIVYEWLKRCPETYCSDDCYRFTRSVSCGPCLEWYEGYFKLSADYHEGINTFYCLKHYWFTNKIDKVSIPQDTSFRPHG
jgi:hypothetical protein